MSTPPDGPDPDGVIDYPGHTDAMSESPRDEMRDYRGRGLLAGKRALITGGDSGYRPSGSGGLRERGRRRRHRLPQRRA